MRQVMVDGAPVDAGPTVFTMRWVFDQIFAAAGATVEDHLKLQPLGVLLRRDQDGDGGRTLALQPPERTRHPHHVPLEGAGDRIVEADRGRIADRGHRVRDVVAAGDRQLADRHDPRLIVLSRRLLPRH